MDFYHSSWYQVIVYIFHVWTFLNIPSNSRNALGSYHNYNVHLTSCHNLKWKFAVNRNPPLWLADQAKVVYSQSVNRPHYWFCLLCICGYWIWVSKDTLERDLNSTWDWWRWWILTKIWCFWFSMVKNDERIKKQQMAAPRSWLFWQ